VRGHSRERTQQRKDTAMSKTDTNLCPRGVYILVGKIADNKQVQNKVCEMIICNMKKDAAQKGGGQE
jgi:hypothetical protein